MKKPEDTRAVQVHWVDPSGQRMLLDGSNGQIVVEVQYGAVTIRATECLLTKFAFGGTPDYKVRKPNLHITLSLHNCRIDWM